MKTTIDREFTPSIFMAQVKEDLQKFRETYKEIDLLDLYNTTVDYCDLVYGEILRCVVRAFDGGIDVRGTAFRVEIIVYSYDEIIELSYYCDLNGSLVDDLTRVTKFQRQ